MAHSKKVNKGLEKAVSNIFGEETRGMQRKLTEKLVRLDLLERKLEVIASILEECKENGQVFGTIDQLKKEMRNFMEFIGGKECEEK